MQLINLIAALALALAGAEANSVTTRATAPKVPVTLQVYRHANSCANVATQCNDRNKPSCVNWDFNIDDSTITNWGVSGSVNQSKIIPQPGIVMSSVLLRAIETGLYQFPLKTVYTVPYVKEVDFKPPNNPLPEKEQKAVIAVLDGPSNAKRVSYKYDSAPQHLCTKGDKTPKCSADWDKFLVFLGEALATNPPAEITKQLAGGEPVSIAIVSHSINIAYNVLKEPKKYISNNQGFEAKFTYDPATKTVTQDAGATWTEITPGVRSPCNGRKLTLADTERCAERNPTNWLTFQQQCL